jgi:hypothetical protein
MPSENRSHGSASNLAAQVAIFVVVLAAVIFVASKYLW